MQKVFKCPYCNTKYIDKKALYAHISKMHPESIPHGMSPAQAYFNNKYKKSGGRCVICGRTTNWNESVERYDRLCSAECKAKYKEDFSKKMMKKYGKVHLLDSDEQQKKMLARRSISGIYTWSDGKSKFTYTGSYEHDFLTFLDRFMQFNPNDVFAPAPQAFKYVDDKGKDRFYIPDFYIASINTLVEIKSRNQNEHFSRTGTDALKEKMKDKVMQDQTQYNFVKILDKDYSIFINFLIDLKNERIKETECKRPVISISESLSIVEENLRSEAFVSDLEGAVINENFTKGENNAARQPRIMNNPSINKMLDESGKIYMATDWHLWKNEDGVIEKNPNFNVIIESCRRTLKPNDTLVYLGDLVDDEFSDKGTLKRVLESINCHKIITMGNNDLFDASFYQECGFDYAVPAFKYKNFVFSHYPIVNENSDVINFHGHLHGSGYYQTPYNNHADVYNRFGKCTSLNEALIKFNRGLYKPRKVEIQDVLTESVSHNAEMVEFKQFMDRLNNNPFIKDEMTFNESTSLELDLSENSDVRNIIERSKSDIRMYLKTNNTFMLKNEACNLWYMYLCLENYTVNPLRKKVVNMEPKQKSEAMQLKATIVSEFTNVLNEIRDRDSKYDFFKSFNESNINSDILKETRNTVDIRKAVNDILR